MNFLNPKTPLRSLWLILTAATLATMPTSARAAEQAATAFSSAWLGDAHWRDGKAEFNIYEGTVSRYGQAQPAEVIHILVREDFASEAHVKADDWERPGVYPVLKLNQVLRVQTGIYVYQQMHSAFWRVGDDQDKGGRLIKWSLTSNDSCGNTFKIADREGERWKYRYDTYWEGMVAGSEDFAVPPDGIYYDELPARVRSIDFGKESGAFTVQLAPSVINSKRDKIAFAPAAVDFTTDRGAGQVMVTVTHAGGKDVFTLDAAPPHLLRVWRPAAGGELRLKQSLKIDYWNYHNLGDRERALNDPALRPHS
jgi:hypothetical protein